MTRLDDLADSVMTASLALWRPEARDVPIDSRFCGPLGQDPQDPPSEWGMWNVIRGRRPLPAQGFKIHVAPRFDEFEEVLAITKRVAREFGITMKHVSRREFLWALYSQNAPRTTAGKVIVLYPRPDDLAPCLASLRQALGPRSGPPVAGDHSLGDSIIHSGWGAFEFSESTPFDEQGRAVIAGPDGTPRVDARVVVPVASDREHLCEASGLRFGVNPHALPDRYRVRTAVTVHAGGGTYLADDLATGGRVVIKRGIRFIGLDERGTDAAQRICDETDTLRLLADDSGLESRVPRLVDSFEIGMSRFLVETFIDGVTLHDWVVSNSPVYAGLDRGTDEYRVLAEAYARRVATMGDQLRELVADLSASGVAHNDLEPSNVLVTGDGVALVDFETASRSRGPGAPAAHGAPWVYSALAESAGDGDLQAVDTLMTYAYWPPVVSAHLDPGWRSRWASGAQRYFAGRTPTTRSAAGTHPAPTTEPPTATEIYRAYANACRHYLDTGIGLPRPLRSPRGNLDNRSVASFGDGLLSLLLLPSDDSVIRAAQQQLLAVVQDGPSRPLRVSDLGLIGGVGLLPAVLERNGNHDAASLWFDAYLELLETAELDAISSRLDTGLSGILTSLLVAADGRPTGHTAAVTDRLGRELEARARHLLRTDLGRTEESERRGLMGGASGMALALSLWSRARGSETSVPYNLIDAERRLYQVVNRVLYFVDGQNTFRPHLDRGNAGLLVAASTILPASELAAQRWQRIAAGLRTSLGVAPGLMCGSAGLLFAASLVNERLGSLPGRIDSDGLLADLQSMLVPTEHGPLAPGGLGRRVTLDGATGAGGVAVAVAAHRGDLELGGLIGTRAHRGEYVDVPVFTR
ncbi:phosphotransferase [Microbacterium sp. Yaish 1]|uniref:class III lanthionine synthetase LanKC N-terminal domain-containing protein n=1 Tax=Microbacterium sp. Yaish 1 TaxID=2025014 RepID=UPI000B94126B|nr:phosphotransferase [Microbacterium sp. Yaish 1]OYC95648.1 hypothetical protein CI089_13260 [Microbacterium sp. Yaish 1]